ncbi:MAG: FAD/NAD(P)-binding protein [Bacteroidota bacterium]
MDKIKRVAILGGGPSGLFMLKRLVDNNQPNIIIDVFEKSNAFGAGMPYSKAGASDEHITNVSGNEIPELVTSLIDWIKTVPDETLSRFKIERDKFHEYRVLPRLLFGQYLSDQFGLILKEGIAKGLEINIHRGKTVTDIIDYPNRNVVDIELDGKDKREFDIAVICTGHRWPIKYESKIAGYYDSPYPPAKLARQCNHTVALKGSSLTAIDAIRTLARSNGKFFIADNKLKFELAAGSPDFKLVMHSRNGMLPGVRFHLEDSHLLKDSVLSTEEVNENRKLNGGFLSLDYVFEKNFKEAFKENRPEFYEVIKDMNMETFVEEVMKRREKKDAFVLFKEEYIEAEVSIDQEESVYWKEMLAVLSFAMNYPAKYFSAEDTQRLQKVLMPLISIVIAFVPQSSVEEMLALHDAGLLEIVSVGEDSEVEPLESGGINYHIPCGIEGEQTKHYETFVDCVGQPHLNYEDFPFKSLIADKTISPARLKFKDNYVGKQQFEDGNKKVVLDRSAHEDGDYYLSVPGIKITDSFNVVDRYNSLNERLYVMAVPYIGGYNPDYSGLDFCEAASEAIMRSINTID